MMTRPVAAHLLAPCLLAAVILSACVSVGSHSPRRQPPPVADDPLPAWADTQEKRTILRYVDEITRPGSSTYIPPQDRLATFDFDGTLGCEKPDYMEVVVAMQRLCEQTKTAPDRLAHPMYQAACEGDLEAIDAEVEDVLLQAFLGTSQHDYTEYVETFLHTARHPRFQRPYGQLYYLPMLQLIDFLRSHQFSVYIVSGSQQGFARAYGTEALRFGASQVIGHTVELEFSTTDGAPRLLRQNAFLAPAVDGKGKVEIIQNRIGRRPVLAFGNSMGDFEMLQYATSGEYPSLALILVHDDPDEYVYRDQELIRHAQALGWQVVRMKENFEVLFPPQEAATH